MKVFVTGGTGFIGGHVVRQLRERGDDVVALVRSREKGQELESLGAQLVEGDLSSTDAIRSACEDCDAVIHGAAVYKVGIPKSEREAMHDANVRGTERVLDAAAAAGTDRTVYVSTVNFFGNTRGQLVDETYRRDEADGFVSCYDETKYRAHLVAEERIAKGAPIVIAQPGAVYGPNDHSEIGNMIDQVRKGRLPLRMFPEAGFMLIHVEDVADGILLALDKGEIGESYVLAGEQARMRDLIDKVAAISGRRGPVGTMPTALIKAAAPFGRVIGPLMGFPPNLRELITVSDGVTYWATDAKARERLGFRPRGLDEGLRETLAAS